MGWVDQKNQHVLYMMGFSFKAAQTGHPEKQTPTGVDQRPMKGPQMTVCNLSRLVMGKMDSNSTCSFSNELDGSCTAPNTARRICASTPTTPALWGARTPTTFSYPGKIKRREDLGTRNFKARNRCEACPPFSSKNFASKAFPPSLSMACSTGPVGFPSAVWEVPRTAEISLRICGPSSHCKNIRAVSTMWGCSALCCWTLDPFPPHHYSKRRA